MVDYGCGITSSPKGSEGITLQLQTGPTHWRRCRRNVYASTALRVVVPNRGAGGQSSSASLTSTPERAQGTPGVEDGLCLPPFACPPPPQPSRAGLSTGTRRHPRVPLDTQHCPDPRRGRTENRAPGGTRRYPWMTRPSALAQAVTRKRVTAVDPTQAARQPLARDGASARFNH